MVGDITHHLTLTQRRTDIASVQAWSSRWTASIVEVGCSMEINQ